MSYDIYLEPNKAAHECNCQYCEYEPPELFWANYTSNVSPMWTEALGYSLRELNGKDARYVASELTQAIRKYQNDPEPYRAMNPPNGWGDADGAFKFLSELRNACEEYPYARVRMSY